MEGLLKALTCALGSLIIFLSLVTTFKSENIKFSLETEKQRKNTFLNATGFGENVKFVINVYRVETFKRVYTNSARFFLHLRLMSSNLIQFIL